MFAGCAVFAGNRQLARPAMRAQPSPVAAGGGASAGE
jgi:hypothetical protein